MRSGAVPQVPQFRPTSTINVNGRDKKVMSEEKSTKSERPKASEQQKAAVNDVSGDPMGNARTKVQEEITKEFAAIMATGTLRASEAAALATKRVMQRYGNLRSAMSQS